MCEGGFNQANCKLAAVIPTVNLIISSVLGRKTSCFSTERSIGLILGVEIPVIETKIIILWLSCKLDTYL